MKFFFETEVEIKIAEARLTILREKKELLTNLMTSCTSNLKEVTSQTSFSNDRMDLYVIKIEEIDIKIIEIEEELSILRSGFQRMKDSLNEVLKDARDKESKICRMYFVENKTPQKIAMELPCGDATVYRYIKKIREKIKNDNE